MHKNRNHRTFSWLAPFKGDAAIWVIFLCLSFISLVSVYSAIGATAVGISHTTPTHAFVKHLVFVLGSYVVAIVVSNINYRRLSPLSFWGYLLSVALLVAVLFIGHREEAAGSGMGRWIELPIIGRFQPSELAKVIVIVFLARLLTLYSDTLKEWKTFRNIMLSVLFVVALILPENLSTAVILFFTCFALMRFTDIDVRHWRRTLLALVLLGVVFILFNSRGESNNGPLARSSTWTSRVDNWLHPDPDELNQPNMARMAIASGKFFGNGVGNTVHARLMSQAHNDFIYAIIIEQQGMAFAIFIFFLYAALYLRCIRIAWKCKGGFGQLTVVGLGTLIFLQAAIHMGVSVGALPVTGQTLPLVSAGGTAYLCMALAMGIIQSVAADVNRKEKRAKALQHTNVIAAESSGRQTSGQSESPSSVVESQAFGDVAPTPGEQEKNPVIESKESID